MNDVLKRVVDCIAITTRYPTQLLVADADLENDLGIDSVKRVEIVTALVDEFELDLLSQERDPSIRTIQHVADWIESHLMTSKGEPPVSDSNTQEDIVPARPSGTVVRQNGSHANSNGQGKSHSGLEDTGSPVSGSAANEAASLRPAGFHPPHAAPISPPAMNGNRLNGTASLTAPSTGGMKNLQGRVALITGSGRGVGRTIARVLAGRGATVLINSFHSRDLGEQTVQDIRAAGGKAMHLWGSVANPSQVDGIFDQINQEIGYLDILVCNASDGKLGSFIDIQQEDWNRAFQTNVTGHYHCAMRASRLMQRRGGGSIVTMSSVAAHRYVQGMGCQGVVKAAVEAMTRNLACELAPYGIRTNCISGGPVYGEVMSQYPESRATFNYWESIVPDGELCSPIDLASTIAFLVSDEARAINGAIWTVDHGASTRAHSRPLPMSARPMSATRPVH